VRLFLLTCSYDQWVASYSYYRCDVSCGGLCIVETVLYDVPSVGAVVSGFYCRRLDYGVLVVGVLGTVCLPDDDTVGAKHVAQLLVA